MPIKCIDQIAPPRDSAPPKCSMFLSLRDSAAYIPEASDKLAKAPKDATIYEVIIGVHGAKADLHLQKLWDRNITITTRLVDTVTTPMLLKTVGAGKVDPKLLITHRFALERIFDAYETFCNATESHALKVIIENTQ